MKIRFLGDPTGKFSEALDVTFDSSAIFGNNRSKRYALLVENGKVKEAFVEPDNTGVNGMELRRTRRMKLTQIHSLRCREGVGLSLLYNAPSSILRKMNVQNNSYNLSIEVPTNMTQFTVHDQLGNKNVQILENSNAGLHGSSISIPRDRYQISLAQLLSYPTTCEAPIISSTANAA